MRIRNLPKAIFMSLAMFGVMLAHSFASLSQTQTVASTIMAQAHPAIEVSFDSSQQLLRMVPIESPNFYNIIGGTPQQQKKLDEISNEYPQSLTAWAFELGDTIPALMAFSWFDTYGRGAVGLFSEDFDVFDPDNKALRKVMVQEMKQTWLPTIKKQLGCKFPALWSEHVIEWIADDRRSDSLKSLKIKEVPFTALYIAIEIPQNQCFDNGIEGVHDFEYRHRAILQNNEAQARYETEREFWMSVGFLPGSKSKTCAVNKTGACSHGISNQDTEDCTHLIMWYPHGM